MFKPFSITARHAFETPAHARLFDIATRLSRLIAPSTRFHPVESAGTSPRIHL